MNAQHKWFHSRIRNETVSLYFYSLQNYVHNMVSFHLRLWYYNTVRRVFCIPFCIPFWPPKYSLLATYLPLFNLPNHHMASYVSLLRPLYPLLAVYIFPFGLLHPFSTFPMTIWPPMSPSSDAILRFGADYLFIKKSRTEKRVETRPRFIYKQRDRDREKQKDRETERQRQR